MDLRALVAVTTLLAGAPAHAQDIIAGIDSIFSFASPDAPGCAVGVSQHGRLVVSRAYGLADVELARGLMIQNEPEGPMIFHTGGAAAYGTVLLRMMDEELSVAALQLRADIRVTARRSCGRPVPAAAGSAVAPVGTRRGSRRRGDGQGRGVLRGALRRAAAPQRQQRQARHSRRATARAGERRPVRSAACDAVLPVAGCLRADVPVARRVRDHVHGRRDVAVPPAPAMDANRSRLAFEGRCTSEDLRPVFEIVPGADGIMMRFENAPEKAVELESVAPDTYMMRMMIVRFRRTPDGRVTFTLDAGGQATALVMRQNGTNRTLVRVR